MRRARFGWILVMLAGGSARAADPAFQFGKPEEVKKVIWKASAQAGLLLTTGNSNTLSFAAAANASRDDGKNRLTLDVNGAYAKSTILLATDADMSGTISADEVQHIDKITTALWSVKLRYDRFFTPKNSVYLTAF